MNETNTKKSIIESARHLFARRGFKGATTAEIAKSAGISEGTIYRHFENKEELMMECVKPIFENMIDIAEHKIFTEAYNLRDIMYKGLELRLNLFVENYDTFRIIFNELPYSDKMKNQYMDFLLTNEGKLTKLIGDMKSMGEIKRSRNFLIFALGQFLALWMYTNFKDWSNKKEVKFSDEMLNISKEHILDDLTDFFMYGIAGKKE